MDTKVGTLFMVTLLVVGVMSLPAKKGARLGTRQLKASSTVPPEHQQLFEHGQRLLQPYPVLELQALSPDSEASGPQPQYLVPQQFEFAPSPPQQQEPLYEEQSHLQAEHQEPEHVAKESVPQHVGSASYDDFAEPRDYRFNYVVNDDYSGNYQSREETKDGHRVSGSYSLREPTGALRIVKYVADEHGFRAIVHRVWDQKRS